MTNQVNVIEKSDRESRIAQAGGIARVTQIRFRGRLTDLPHVSVPLELPIYRMANIRTIVRQGKYVSDHHMSENFFAAGQEDVSAQRAQHDLLLPLAKADRANIYGVLADEAEQSEALVITTSGIVLNGNRRLAAMRDLFAGDSIKYRRFESVEVAVLPADTNDDDLAQIETDLQIAPDMRLDYGWVEEGLALRRQTNDLGWDMAKATLHWRQTEPELKRRLSMLELAEEYLEYLDDKADYERVRNDELAFDALQRKQQGRDGEDPARLEAERLLVYAELANQDQVTGRIYDHARDIDKVLPRVLEDPDLSVPSEPEPAAEPAEEGGEPATEDASAAATPTEPPAGPHAAVAEDPLAYLPGEPTQSPAKAALDFLRNKDNWKTIAKSAGSAYIRIQEEKREDRRTGRFGGEATRINAMAAGLTLRNAKPETFPTAAAQLVAATKSIADRLEEIALESPAAFAGLDRDALAQAAEKLQKLADD
jgi:hypothetical protein